MSTHERPSGVGTELRRWFADVPWWAGLAGGAGAFLGGYLLVILVIEVPGGGSTGTIVGQLTLIAMVFYNAQHIALRTTNHFAPWALDAHTYNFLADNVARGSMAVPPVVYYAVPVVVLLVAGVLLARRQHDDRVPLPETAARTGVSLVPGYLLLGLIGVGLFSYPTLRGHVARPDVLGVLLFGIAYPLVLGTVGGYVGAILGRGRS
ncbi:MAG: hypothetical protein ABEJ89_08410 [Haloarculaceae archaeon]